MSYGCHHWSACLATFESIKQEIRVQARKKLYYFSFESSY